MSAPGSSTNPLAAWWDNLVSEAKAEVAKLASEAEAIAVEIGTVVVSDLEAGLQQLGQLAIQAVLTEAPKVISGTEKFGNAVASVTQQVEAAGKSIVIADAQMAVQAAYHATQVAVSGG